MTGTGSVEVRGRLVRSLPVLLLLGAACPQTVSSPDAGGADAGADASVEDAGPVDAGPPPPPQPRSAHHMVQSFYDDMVEASVEVRIDEVPTHGLRFFALQVNYHNGAWAHGGFQRDPSDGYANFGGLLSGIDYDYRDRPLEVLAEIQNLPGRSRAATWETGRWYRYVIRRGPQETLPAGPYSVLDEPPVEVPNDRTLWRWDFEAVAVDTSEVVWTQSLYVRSETMKSFIYWTETGYGITCEDVLTVRWRNPEYVRVGGNPVRPYRMTASLAQSDCPLDRTTNIVPEANGGRWGTLQQYAVPRTTEHGAQLYGP